MRLIATIVLGVVTAGVIFLVAIWLLFRRAAWELSEYEKEEGGLAE